MPNQSYDPVGAMGGMFAPAYIHGNPEAEAAVQQWQAENFGMTNPGVDATRGPSTTVANTGGFGLRGGGGTTSTIPGSVDPEALRALAQGGKYVPKAVAAPPAAAPAAAANPAANAQRDAITGALLGAGRIPNAAAGSLMRQQPPPGGIPPGYMMPDSPLLGLMGEGDNQGFMQGSFAGGA